MYYPDSVVTLHKKLLKAAGLEHIRFHNLRHTFATLALQNGVDVKTVSNMLGHCNAVFTLTTYAHATRQMQENTAQRMGSFMAQNLQGKNKEHQLDVMKRPAGALCCSPRVGQRVGRPRRSIK